MLYRGIAWWFRRDLDRLSFADQTHEGRELFKEIFDLIRDGGVLGFHNVQEEELQARCARLPWHLRPFLHEGHGIGFAGRKAIRLRPQNPEASFDAEANRAIRYLCYGYWMAITERYPLPSWKLGGPPWSAEQTHARYRRLMINGLGFGRVLLAGKLEARILDSLARSFSGDDLQAALHGVGRVLWFLHLGNPEALRDLLTAHPSYASRLAVGVGTAITFTQVLRTDDVLSTLNVFGPELQSSLRSGMGIALRFHAVNDAEARTAIEASLRDETAGWYAAARAASEVDQDSAGPLSWHCLPLTEAHPS